MGDVVATTEAFGATAAGSVLEGLVVDVGVRTLTGPTCVSGNCGSTPVVLKLAVPAGVWTVSVDVALSPAGTVATNCVDDRTWNCAAGELLN